MLDFVHAARSRPQYAEADNPLGVRWHVDVSDSRPNVLHEIGFAEALGKPVIQICSTGTNALPFNVRNNQTIPYSIGQTAKLRKRLESELQKVI